jgi:flagellar basal body-associated protein FliL
MEKVKNNRKKFIIISLTVIIVIVLVVATIESVTTGRSLDECFFGACCGILYMTG